MVRKNGDHHFSASKYPWWDFHWLLGFHSTNPLTPLSVTHISSLGCSCSVAKFYSRLFVTLRTAARQASLTLTISHGLLKLMTIESVSPSNHLILCHSLLLLPSIFCRVRVFSNESSLCIWWPKHWNFSITPSNEYSGLISFRIDWFVLLAFQWTRKNLLQQHSLKASVLLCSAFFMVQLSHPCMTTSFD